MFDKRWVIVNIVTNLVAYILGTVVAVVTGVSLLGILVMIVSFYVMVDKVYNIYDAQMAKYSVKNSYSAKL